MIVRTVYLAGMKYDPIAPIADRLAALRALVNAGKAKK